MKKILLIILPLLLIVGCGKKDGVHTTYHEYYPNNKKEEGNYKDGKKIGKWTKWYNEGWVLYEANYKDGKLDGLYEQYVEVYNGSPIREESEDYIYGNLELTGNYKDGKKDGKWQTGFMSRTRLDGNYKDGKREGKWIEFEHIYLSSGTSDTVKINTTIFYENDKMVNIIDHRKKSSVTSADCSDSGMEKLARSRSQLLGTVEIFSDFGGGSYFVKFISDGRRYEGFMQLKCRNGKAEVVKSKWDLS